jgi:arginase
VHIHLIAVPYDTARRGWRMGAGPEHLLSRGIETRLRALGHGVSTTIVEAPEGGPAEIATAFALMASIATIVRGTIAEGAFPLVLSGNCNTASGTLAGLTPRDRSVYWFDAHGDVNTADTTITGFLDGTALATAMGWCWNGLTRQIPGFEPVNARDVLLLGARDLDPGEIALLDRSKVRTLSSGEIEAGALADLPEPRDGIAYVHCDLDVLDPSVGQANPFPVPGGLTVVSLMRAIRTIGRVSPIAAAAVTAYAPEYDADQRINDAALTIIETIIGCARRG